MIALAVPMTSVALLIAFAAAWAAEAVRTDARPIRMLDFRD